MKRKNLYPKDFLMLQGVFFNLVKAMILTITGIHQP